MVEPHVLDVLSDPVAVELIGSRIPARLAYTAADGTPRAIPIGFHWTGDRFVMCTVPHAPKVAALRRHPQVAFTVDTEGFPPHVLMVRGRVTAIEIVDGVPDDYLLAASKTMEAEQLAQFETQVRGLYKQMAKISIEPTWVKVLDFETRIPTPIEQLIRQA